MRRLRSSFLVGLVKDVVVSRGIFQFIEEGAFAREMGRVVGGVEVFVELRFARLQGLVRFVDDVVCQVIRLVVSVLGVETALFRVNFLLEFLL